MNAKMRVGDPVIVYVPNARRFVRATVVSVYSNFYYCQGDYWGPLRDGGRLLPDDEGLTWISEDDLDSPKTDALRVAVTLTR